MGNSCEKTAGEGIVLATMVEIVEAQPTVDVLMAILGLVEESAVPQSLVAEEVAAKRLLVRLVNVGAVEYVSQHPLYHHRRPDPPKGRSSPCCQTEQQHNPQHDFQASPPLPAVP